MSANRFDVQPIATNHWLECIVGSIALAELQVLAGARVFVVPVYRSLQRIGIDVQLLRQFPDRIGTDDVAATQVAAQGPRPAGAGTHMPDWTPTSTKRATYAAGIADPGPEILSAPKAPGLLTRKSQHAPEFESAVRDEVLGSEHPE